MGFTRRTIMKFYSRILGDRDYSLFDVLHFGLRLPGTLSSFGDVKRASVSNRSTVKTGHSACRTKANQRITNRSALEAFNRRGELRRPATLREETLEGLSFYAFSRLFDVASGVIVQKGKRSSSLSRAQAGPRRRSVHTRNMKILQEKRSTPICLVLDWLAQSTSTQP